MLIADLTERIEIIIKELNKESFNPYIQENHKLQKDIKFRVACILSKFSYEDFGLT